MTEGRRTALTACLLVLAAPLAGCRFERVKPEPNVSTLNPTLDPCAARLHDVAGSLLLHYAAAGDLPPDLAGVKKAGGEACPPLECPVSKMPYLYNPAGLIITGQPGRLVLYDAEPSHNGMRWGLIVNQAGRGKALEVRVILLPNNALPASPTRPDVSPAK